MVEEKGSGKLEIYQQLFEASEDPMWLIVDGKFEVSNKAAQRLYNDLFIDIYLFI